MIGLITSIVIAVSPLLLVWIVSFIADINGCNLNEGMVEPCMVSGVDIGSFLYSLFMSGWYLFITFPLGGILFFGSLIWLALTIRQLI